MKWKFTETKFAHFDLRLIEKDNEFNGIINLSGEHKIGKREVCAIRGAFIPVSMTSDKKSISYYKDLMFFYGSQENLHRNHFSRRGSKILYSDDRIDKMIQGFKIPSGTFYLIPREALWLGENHGKLLEYVINEGERWLSSGLDLAKKEVDASNPSERGALKRRLIKFPTKFIDDILEVGSFYSAKENVNSEKTGEVKLPNVQIIYTPSQGLTSRYTRPIGTP